MVTQAERRPRLGSLLIEKGFLRREQLEDALELQKSKGRGRLLGEILVDEGFCSEDHVVECLAAEYDYPYAKLDPRLCDPAAVDLLPRDFIE